jgi:hypothetical protein
MTDKMIDPPLTTLEQPAALTRDCILRVWPHVRKRGRCAQRGAGRAGVGLPRNWDARRL